MKEKFGPCLEKKCSWCCNPVKVDRLFSENKIPANKEGKLLWKSRYEILAPRDEIEIKKLKTYDCINYNKIDGRCKDYKNRPDICKNTSCIDE
jgi:Fe-S-cluster containining protein